MRTSTYYILFILLSSFLLACSGSYAPYGYDDLYYSPKNDPVKKVQKDPREDFNKTDNVTYDNAYPNRYQEEDRPSNYPESIYQNRYTQAETEENQKSAETENMIEQDEVEYYDEDYANSIKQINSPVRSFSSYDPYQRDRILYTQDPFFNSPTVCNQYQIFNPYTPRATTGFGYRNLTGWNAGFNIGYGNTYGYNSFRNPYNYAPFYSYSPFPRYNYWDPYRRFNNYGYNSYWAGYRNGFNNNNGNSHNNYNSQEQNNTSNKRRINAPRGNNGSPTYGNIKSNSRTRTEKSQNSTIQKSGIPAANPASRSIRTRPSSTVVNESTSRRSNTSPSRYRNRNTINTYSKPKGAKQNFQSTNTSPNIISKELNQSERSQPNVINQRKNNSYNQTRRPVYNNQEKPRQINTHQETNRKLNNNSTRSRSTYNRSSPSYNRTKPSYSPPKNTGTRGKTQSSSRSRRR